MISVDVAEFLIREDVELDSEDVVVRVAVVGQIEETQVLSGAGSVDPGGRCEEEDDPVARERVFERSHGEDEGG